MPLVRSTLDRNLAYIQMCMKVCVNKEKGGKNNFLTFTLRGLKRGKKEG